MYRGAWTVGCWSGSMGAGCTGVGDPRLVLRSSGRLRRMGARNRRRGGSSSHAVFPSRRHRGFGAGRPGGKSSGPFSGDARISALLHSSRAKESGADEHARRERFERFERPSCERERTQVARQDPHPNKHMLTSRIRYYAQKGLRDLRRPLIYATVEDVAAPTLGDYYFVFDRAKLLAGGSFEYRLDEHGRPMVPSSRAKARGWYHDPIPMSHFGLAVFPDLLRGRDPGAEALFIRIADWFVENARHDVKLGATWTHSRGGPRCGLGPGGISAMAQGWAASALAGKPAIAPETTGEFMLKRCGITPSVESRCAARHGRRRPSLAERLGWVGVEAVADEVLSRGGRANGRRGLGSFRDPKPGEGALRAADDAEECEAGARGRYS